MSDNKTPMTPEAASRIQSHADRTGTNQDFKARAQAASAQPSAQQPAGAAGPVQPSSQSSTTGKGQK